MPSVFLTAEWRKLILANYSVDSRYLLPHLPARTELDSWQGTTYVSLVGFLFRDVRVRGLMVPFHTKFPEVNLRFYVRYNDNGDWKRGVVFVSEIVPKPAISWVANTIFKERYRSLPMRHFERTENGTLHAGYQWRLGNEWNGVSVRADAQSHELKEGSQEEFITEHFWGYTKTGPDKTGEYQVTHPRWDIYSVREYRIDCDFGRLYGKEFADLRDRKPESVFLAEGSPVSVYSKRMI